MRLVLRVVLYTALLMGANLAHADPALEALRQGSMKKLIFHAEPRAVTDQAFKGENGRNMTLGDLQGRYVLVNFWATWCAPCRHEMPSLNALQKEFGGDKFQVVTIATGRNNPAGINRFFDEESIDVLPKHTDASSHLARSMSVLGLPMSILLGPDGTEIARLRGDADWYSDSARAIFANIVARPSS